VRTINTPRPERFLGAARVAAFILLVAGRGALATVPPDLREMKRSHDLIQSSVPESWANRLSILKAVTARRSNAATWEHNKQRAEELWHQWQPIHDQLAAGQHPAYEADELAQDRQRMEQCAKKFRPVRELLIDHGLAEVKKALAYQLYLVANPDPALVPQDQEDLGLDSAFYLDAVDESLAQFKTRVKGRIRHYLRPTEARWFWVTGYHFGPDPYVRGQGTLEHIPIHWTLYRANLGNVANLEIRAGTPDDTLKAIRDALVPSGTELVGVHVTLERYGASSENNPRVFGRPASTARQRNEGNLPDDVTLLDMADKLNQENDRLVNRIDEFVRRRAAHIQAGWANH